MYIGCSDFFCRYSWPIFPFVTCLLLICRHYLYSVLCLLTLLSDMLKIFSTSPPHLSAFYFALYLHRSLHRSFVCCQICWCFHFWFLGFVPCRGRLGRKVMTNLDSIFKNRDITLPTKVRLSQGYGFSCGHVWM